MNTTAVVIGAGIAGPTATIALQNHGYDVTCYEARPESAVGSTHVISLEDDVIGTLLGLGIRHSELFRIDGSIPWRREESFGTAMIDSQTGRAPGELVIVWNDLHTALAKRCQIEYGHKITAEPTADLVVWADGIGSTGRKLHSPESGTYGCEMIYRGLAPRRDRDRAWFNLRDARSNAWEMVAYPTWDDDGRPMRGWTMFTNTPTEPSRNTRTLTPRECETLCEAYKPTMHSRPYKFLRDAVEIKAAPQIWWEGLSHMHFQRGSHHTYLIGDGAGTVSPRTASGANSAIREAMAIPAMDGDTWDTRFTELRNRVLDMTREIQRESGLRDIHSIHG
jgi:2-polyprenyl-6-methoxyphenol hydroxylase-like FAD-dependent oxidoreductase